MSILSQKMNEINEKLKVTSIDQDTKMRIQTLQDLLLLAIEGKVDGSAYETLRIMRWNLKYVRSKL